MLPLATFETPLWPSTHRGARGLFEAGGVRAVVIDDRMARSVLFEAGSVIEAHEAVINLMSTGKQCRPSLLKPAICRLIDMHTQVCRDVGLCSFRIPYGRCGRSQYVHTGG